MKKQIAIGFTLLLLLSGCAQQEAPATEAPTTQPTVPETTTQVTIAPTETEARKPECRDVAVMGENIPLIRFFLDEGETVEVVGYQDALARVSAKGREGFVELQYLRFPDEVFEGFTGYARWNTGFYRDTSCLGDPMRTLNTNTKLEVLEELDDCYYVNFDGMKGYVKKAQLSKWVVQSLPEDPGGASSGGGGGGSSSRDGEEITLMERGNLLLLAEEVKTGTAKVKVSQTPVVIRGCLLGEALQMVVSDGFAEEIPGYAAILEPDGTYAYISEDWVLLPDQASFAGWEGYAGYNCKLYTDETLSGKEAKTLYANTKVTVLWDTGTVSYIQAGEETYYAASSTLRRTPIVAAPTEEGSGHSSSGSSGSKDTWTPAKK